MSFLRNSILLLVAMISFDSSGQTTPPGYQCPSIPASTGLNQNSLLNNAIASYQCACRGLRESINTKNYCENSKNSALRRCAVCATGIGCVGDRLKRCICEVGDLMGLGGECTNGKWSWKKCTDEMGSSTSGFIGQFETLKQNACASIKSVDSTNKIAAACDCSDVPVVDNGTGDGGNPFGIPLPPPPGNNEGDVDLNLPPPVSPVTTTAITTTSASGSNTGTVSGATTAGNSNVTGGSLPNTGTTAGSSGLTTGGGTSVSSPSGTSSGLSNSAKAGSSASGGGTAGNPSVQSSQTTAGGNGADTNGGAGSGSSGGNGGVGADGTYGDSGNERTSPFRVVEGERIGVSRGDTIFRQINNGYDNSIPRGRFNLK